MNDKTILQSAPFVAKPAGRFQFGQYHGPITFPRLTFGGKGGLRLKHWHYTAVSTTELFLAFALVDLGYASNMFVYWVDRRNATNAMMECSAIRPAGAALSFAPSSVRGETRWQSREASVRICGGDDEMTVALDAKMGGLRLRADLRLFPGPGLGLLFNLGDEEKPRPAYTHKSAGFRSTGTLRVGDERLSLEGDATLDWTRSVASRTTSWKWASFAGRAGGSRVGLNLSAEIYDKGGDSQENAFWKEGSFRLLGGVRFELPSNPRTEPWRIHSKVGNEVSLRFTPLGARHQDLNLGLIRSRFVQPYGVFEGQVLGTPIKNVFGVVEDHLSVW